MLLDRGQKTKTERQAPKRSRPRRWGIAAGVVALVVVLLVVNALLVNAETRSAELTHPEGQLLDLPGGQQQIVDEGPRAGRALVLLHPYVSSLHSWERVADAASKSFRVVRLDLLGFGGSAKPDSGYAIDEQAEYLAGALEILDVRRAVVAGNSYGAIVATALAEQHPALVAGVAIVDMAPDRESFSDAPTLQSLSYRPIIGQLLRRITLDSQAESTIEKQLFSPGFDPDQAFDEPDRIIEDFRAMTYTSYKASAEASDDYTQQTPLDERLTAIGEPALIVFGSEDQTFPAEESLDAYRDVPDARSVLIDGAGHAPQLEQPREVTRLLLRFADESFSPQP
jgi:pimeloyl-ACP methyl ester carboxylesterase